MVRTSGSEARFFDDDLCNKAETIYFNFNAKCLFKDLLPQTTLNVVGFHLSFPKFLSSAEGQYHLTIDISVKNKSWLFHSFYDERDGLLLTTVSSKSEKRKQGVRTTVQLVESTIEGPHAFKVVDNSHPLYQLDVSKIRTWAENYFKVLMAELKVGFIRTWTPKIQEKKSENSELDYIIDYFSNDFWPEGMKERHQLRWLWHIKVLIEQGAFTQDEVGLKLYKMLSKKIYANKNRKVDKIGNNFSSICFAVQELLRFGLLNVDTLALIEKAPVTRELAFELVVLNRYELFYKYIDVIKKVDPSIQIDIIRSLVILHEFNVNVNETLLTQLCKHSSPVDFALLLSVMVYFEENEHTSLEKEDIDLAYQYVKPQFLEAYFETLQETNRASVLKSKIFSFYDDVREPLMPNDSGRIYLEQVWFIINKLFAKQSNSELLEKLLTYTGSGKKLYESIFLLFRGGVLQKENIDLFQLILEFSDPEKLSYALNMLMYNDLLNDTDLRNSLISLLREVGDDCVKVSKTVVNIKKIDLLSVDMLPLMKNVQITSPSRFKGNLLSSFNQLFGTPEKKALFLPLIMPFARLMSGVDILPMIAFISFFHDDANIISLFKEKEDFVEKMSSFLKKNNIVKPEHLLCTNNFIKRLSDIGLLSAVTLDTILCMNNQDIAELTQTRCGVAREIDLKNFMDMMKDLLEHNLYLGFKNIKSPIQHVSAAYQNIINYCDPTKEILVKLLNFSVKSLKEISKCSSIEEIMCLLGLSTPSGLQLMNEKNMCFQEEQEYYNQCIFYHQEQLMLLQQQPVSYDQQEAMCYHHEQAMQLYFQQQEAVRQQVQLHSNQQQTIFYQYSGEQLSAHESRNRNATDSARGYYSRRGSGRRRHQ